MILAPNLMMAAMSLVVAMILAELKLELMVVMILAEMILAELEMMVAVAVSSIVLCGTD